MSGKSYHGPTPVTSSDKEMAGDHLERTEDLLEERHELLMDKIKDHAKAMEKAKKDGNKRSFNYNKVHKVGHEDEDDDVDKEKAKIQKSKATLSKLKTYNDVRKSKVAMMQQKAGV